MVLLAPLLVLLVLCKGTMRGSWGRLHSMHVRRGMKSCHPWDQTLSPPPGTVPRKIAVMCKGECLPHTWV